MLHQVKILCSKQTIITILSHKSIGQKTKQGNPAKHKWNIMNPHEGVGSGAREGEHPLLAGWSISSTVTIGTKESKQVIQIAFQQNTAKHE